MKIIKGWPPNLMKIAKVFPGAMSDTVIFAYAPDIYCPGQDNLPPQLVAHEGVHIARQLDMGVEEWWDRYLVDAEWRYHEELLAHRAEYKMICELNPSRQTRRAALKIVGKRLASAMYGKMVTLDRAMKDIAA